MDTKDMKSKRITESFKRTIVIGAGEAGYITVRTLLRAKRNVICIIDDDKAKIGSDILGVKIAGTRDDIARLAAENRANEIIFAIPSLPNAETKKFYDICKNIPTCELKKVPDLLDFVEDRFEISDIKKVRIEDLLGRTEVNIDLKSIGAYISGKRILITGGGGSIGRELCRQAAKFVPGQLVIFDIYENHAYEIQQELKARFVGLDIKVVIGSVRDKKRLNEVFSKFRPEIVYHAAAHKHVPLMESSPCEAVKNNVFGTLNTAQAAVQFGVKKFVLISTDKAVNPANIMGITKMLCEQMLQLLGRRCTETEFVAVRFGNVLDSDGSVIPLFRTQIERGGPVTVTHPEITRYFMTISEAVSLVLQASIFACGGEVFVLDMGSPIKIDTLARNMIRLAGAVPDEDIKIIYTGLRPGEKLFEEPLVSPSENLAKTSNDLIYIEKQQDYDGNLHDIIKNLEKLSDSGNDVMLKKYLAELVPTYKALKE